MNNPHHPKYLHHSTTSNNNPNKPTKNRTNKHTWQSAILGASTRSCPCRRGGREKKYNHVQKNNPPKKSLDNKPEESSKSTATKMCFISVFSFFWGRGGEDVEFYLCKPLPKRLLFGGGGLTVFLNASRKKKHKKKNKKGTPEPSHPKRTPSVASLKLGSVEISGASTYQLRRDFRCPKSPHPGGFLAKKRKEIC